LNQNRFLFWTFGQRAASGRPPAARSLPSYRLIDGLAWAANFAFVDHAPTSQRKHGFPTKFSAGDELVFTNPLEQEGKLVGKIRVVNTATKSASSKHFAAARFICSGIAKIPGGTLVFAAELSEGNTEGVITGGSGKYAGARGSFVSKEGNGSSTTTVTLLE